MISLEHLFIITFLILILSFSFLAYIFIGYPAIIFGLSKFFGRPIKKSDFLPSVTIVIPTFNEEGVIKEKIENTLSLAYPKENLQILVCDDFSNDRTREIVESFKEKGVILSKSLARAGKIGGLNRAIPLATGEIFVISDADILANTNTLQELISNFSDETVGCVIAQTHMLSSENNSGESGGLYWKYESMIRQSESDLHSTVAATGHFMGIRKKILQPIPQDIILDDFYLATATMQQGFRVVFEPKAMAWERPTTSMEDEVNRRRRLTAGRYQIIFMWKNYLSKLPLLLKFQVVSHKFLRLAIPHFMILAFVSNIALHAIMGTWATKIPALIQQSITVTLLLQILFYGMALAGWYFSNKGRKKTKLIKVLTIPYYLCATNFASILGMFWYLSGKRTVLWQQARRQ
jgi:biofilm PGA synthesis N-glycosyltransferase PgaC